MGVRRARRLLWLGVLTLVPLLALVGRLFYLQVVKNVEYTAIARRQRVLPLKIGEDRGLIVDRNGQPLSDPQELWGIGIFPSLLREHDRLAAKLDPYMQETRSEIAALLREPKGQRWLVTTDLLGAAAEIAGLNLQGVAVGPVVQRYGDQALARHLLGYLHGENGAAGLEKVFDADLNGTAVSTMSAFLDGTGKTIDGLGIKPMGPGRGKRPYRLETTLDLPIQQAVERVLDQKKDLKAAVVVLEPKTGEVLAMASRPNFTAGESGLSGTGEGYLLNRTVRAYPPGSVFKLVAAAAALEDGVVSPSEHFVCDGEYDLKGTIIPDHSGGPHGQITFRDAIAKSCNVAFMEIGDQRLGADGLRAAAERFGFGRATGVLGAGREWEEEQAGHVAEVGQPGAVQMAIGQGELLVTPLQVARFYAAIANGGVLPQLKLVKRIKTPAGEVVQRPAPAGRAERIMSRDTAEALQEALLAVTDPKGQGTGRTGWVEQGGSAGKTGTAEVTPTLSHAWFAGYLPASRPRYVVVVLVEGGGSGSGAAAPIFAKIGAALAER